MEKIQEQECASIGKNVSLLCATLGALAPAAMALNEIGHSLPGGRAAHQGFKWLILIGLIVSLTALYFAAAFLGRKAGKSICRHKMGYAGAILVGVGLALSCFAVGGGVAAGFMVADASRVGARSASFVMSFIPLFGVVGALAAALLGVLYGVLVRVRLTATVSGKEA